MSRYIDTDKLSVQFKAIVEHAEMEGLYNQAHLYKRCLELIEDTLTADVVEVVRCKGCKFYKAYEPPIEDFDGFCTANENEYDKDFFCQYGERREDTE